MPYIQSIENSSTLVLWLRFTDVTRTTHNTIILGNIYPGPLLELKTEVAKYENDNILLMGDFNSRTSDKNDYIESDEYISKLFTDEEMLFESSHAIYSLNKINFPLKRNTLDKKLNRYGRQFLDFCAANDIFILNDRIEGDKYFPSFTCKGCSTVDYFACSVGLKQFVKYMNVKRFSSLISDVHCPIELILYLDDKIKSDDFKEENKNYNKEKLWNSKKKRRSL